MRNGYDPARPRPGSGPAGGQPLARGRPAAPAPTAPTPERIKADVGRFFLDLRQTYRLSQAQAAKRLATRPEIIAALEGGDVRNLPPWPETCRIVRGYTGLAGLDPRPVLQLIEALHTLAARAPAPAPSRALVPVVRRPSSPVMRPAAQPAPAPDNDEDEDHPGWIASVGSAFVQVMPGRSLRALLALSVPVAIVVLLTQTSVLEAAVSQLPPSVARIVRGAQNYVIVQLAPIRDGLRWIDVPDPRTRRSDKLQTAAQSD